MTAMTMGMKQLRAQYLAKKSGGTEDFNSFESTPYSYEQGGRRYQAKDPSAPVRLIEK